MKKVAFCTLGCKVNQYETNAMEDKLRKAGYKIVGFDEVADVYIINTCTVTNIADKKSRQMIRRAKNLNLKALVIAVGCYAQVAKEKLEGMEELDIILGNQEKKDIVQYLSNYFEKNALAYSIHDVMHEKEFADFGTTTHIEKTRAVIKVQDGCNQFCSYCIIPYARGRIRSRKMESVLEEINALAKEGIREVVITGIHVASYGKDLQNKISLIDLLEKINEVEGIQRIRLGSLEPTIITEEFLERLKKLSKICHHFHLSLQSGCNATLKRMNRHYTVEDFEKVVHLLRNTYKDVILTTDIIVGFPDETEEEFKNTYAFLEKICFYKMHIFKYSRRKGTKAAEMPNQISAVKQEERSKKLIDLSNQNQQYYHEQYKEKELEVLLEEEDGKYIYGHTANYMMVRVKKDKNLHHNQVITVKITKNEGEILTGEEV